ncbi:uroporphyrinogen decarboxylase family protein [Sporomusa sp.]|uniref:uroporphyrinogen decarboxylase family protein n=1 Tax=Sporomusa sp. TaxID=2078658 RepID=UPI002CB98CDF|nr:uroporphyrinogen decarboxylase family protein [Sporomusa sp.]HWR45508.1 uroporphyrinogen decarboxylase family protein [Sporomusa sp.]
MCKNVMTPEERLVATINHEPVDRIVCAPWIVNYAAQFAGVTNKDFMWNWDVAMDSYAKLAETYPEWDCYAGIHYQYGDATLMSKIGFNNCKFPGRDLEDNAMYQILEPEVMSRDELRLIKTAGIQAYIGILLKKLHDIDPPEIGQRFMESGKYQMMDRDAAYARGQSCLYGGTAPTGNELFAITRSFDKYIKDMFQMGDELVEILWRFNQEFFPRILGQVEKSGIRRVFFPATRTGSSFLNKKMFERFTWPVVKDMAENLIKHDIIPVFHVDTDWGRDLENFLQLPKRKFVLELDGETDIFKAKEILNGHACLSGDVPAALLSLGTTDEVDEYCKKLITVIGKDGGFILRPGCTMPMNAKHENVKAMFNSVEKYGRYN